MRILNYEVNFSVQKRHSFWDLFRFSSGGMVTRDYPSPEDKCFIGLESEPWEHKINPEKRLHAMHSDILVYAFRDVAIEMTMFPEKAGAIFLGIVAFTETFKNDMLIKGASEESVIEYDVAVNEHIDIVLNSIKRSKPEMYEDILSYLEDDNNDS